MKFLIVVAILTVVAASVGAWPSSPVCVNTSLVHACVTHCGGDTILLTKNCASLEDLYWTGCLVKCLKIERIGPKPWSCVSLCDLQKFLKTFGKCTV